MQKDKLNCKMNVFSGRPKVLAITGGKGGIGKTNIAINLSIALSHMSQKVMLLDADMGLSNVDVMLGLKPKHNISHVLGGECSLEDIIISGPNDIGIVPSGSGNTKMASIGHAEVFGIVQLFSQLIDPPNYLIVDTAAGITESVVGLASAADEVIVVVCNEPTSIADVYALIKLLNKQFSIYKFRVITNKTRRIGESEEVFAKLTKVADKFLNVSLTHIGAIPEDKFMKRAIRKTRAVAAEYPNATSSHAFFQLAESVMNLQVAQQFAGSVKFFQQQVT